MRSSSLGRKSSINPVRISTFDRGDKSATSELRVSNIVKTKGVPGSDSQIFRSRIRSSSSDRGSIRRSNLKAGISKSTNGPYYQLSTPVTPRVGSQKIVSELPTGPRGKSPSAERASGLSANNGPKKDSRPLNDKNFQTEMLIRIDEFFKDANQLTLLNPNGSLKPMSLKIFVSTSDFLLKLLDLKVELNSNNYMEELPKIAKKIHYPGVMAKSWLKTANTMHSWPHVLGWLSWLVEICEVKDIAHEKFQLYSIPFIESEVLMNRNLFIKILKMYKIWNDGQEDQEDILIDEYVKSVSDELGLQEENLLIAEAEVNEQQKKLDEILIDDNEIQAEYEAKLATLEALKLELNDEIAIGEEQEKCLKDGNYEIENLNKELEILEISEINYLEQQQKLNVNIKQQVITAEERDAIMKKCSDLQNYINQFDAHVNELEEESWAIDLKISRKKENLNKAILEYNRDIAINILPDASNLQLPESSFSDPDFKNCVHEKLDAMKKLEDTLRKKSNNYKSMIESYTNELDSLQEKQKIQEQERNAWLAENDQKKMSMKSIQLRMKDEEVKSRAILNKLRDDINNLKQSIRDEDDNLDKVRNDISEEREKLEAIERRQEFLVQQSQSFFDKFYKLLNSDAAEMATIAKSLDPE